MKIMIAERSSVPPAFPDLDHQRGHPRDTTQPLQFGRAQLFPTTRRPATRHIATDISNSDTAVDAWFTQSDINVYAGRSKSEFRRVKRILYTWRDVFEDDMLKIRKTDLIKHCIPLLPNAQPFKAKLPLYTDKERHFCNKVISQMKKAGLIYHCDSECGAWTTFNIKNNPTHGTKLRMVHNFILQNRFTRKSRYPMPLIEQIIHCIYKNGKKVFFVIDAPNSYYAIPLRRSDWLLTAFVCPNGEYCYGFMGQGLTGGVHTYSRFRDLTCGNIEADDTSGTPPFPSIISDHGDVAFDGMVDGSYGSNTDFVTMFQFLLEVFFPRPACGPLYLKGAKSYFFYPSLECLGLEGCNEGLLLSLKKHEQTLGWKTPKSQEEVEAFYYLTPFLCSFLPGRAKLCGILLDHEKPAKTTRTQLMLSATYGSSLRNPKPFQWSRAKEDAFALIKQSIAENAMVGPDCELQFHMAVDASKKAISAVLFQLHGPPTGTKEGPEYRTTEWIICFFSFKLTAAETRYSNRER